MKVGQNASPSKDGTLAEDSKKVHWSGIGDLTQREWDFAMSLNIDGYMAYLDARQEGKSHIYAVSIANKAVNKGRAYAEDRHESDCCQVGTQGCAINHFRDVGDCATW